MRKIRSLKIDNLCKQLVLQAISGDSEVNKSGLSLYLWLIVGIGQLSVQNEPEVWVKDALLISHLYKPEQSERQKNTVSVRCSSGEFNPSVRICLYVAMNYSIL